MRLNHYIGIYSNLYRWPKYWHLFRVLPTLIRRGPSACQEFIRFVRSNQFDEVSWDERDNLPSIEILLAAIEKDFWLLPYSLKLAVQNSLNPVIKITIITQDHSLAQCRDTLERIDLGVPIEVLSEDQQLKESFRALVRDAFRDRYGWALQQFLTVNYIINSKNRGVLAINADTLILKKQAWLTESHQVLMVSSEFHPPYYEILTKLGLPCKNPKFTFVTHHMMFIPQKFQSILMRLEIIDLDDLLLKTLQALRDSKDKSICVEFELYAQGLLRWFPESIKLTRFGNLGISAKENKSGQNLDILINSDNFSGYNSLSIHSWS